MRLYGYYDNGRVAEWFIAAVLKTAGRDERPLGSNPGPSAKNLVMLK